MRNYNWFLIVLFQLLFSIDSNAQNAKLEWVKPIWTSLLASNIKHIGSDVEGNLYVAGYYNGTVDLDPGPNTTNITAVQETDIAVCKFDMAGIFLWGKSIGGNGVDRVNSIAIDDSGNVYISGCFTETADFDPGPATYNMTATLNTNAYVCKLDPSGNFLWARRFLENQNAAVCYSITLDSSENLYVTGYVTGIYVVGPTTYFIPESFIGKCNSSGDLLWIKRFGNSKDIYWDDFIPSVKVGNYGHIYITGKFSNNADFDPGPGVYNLSTGAADRYDMYVTKFDTSGNFIWVKQFIGKSENDQAPKLVIDEFENLYLTGIILDTIDFDPSSNEFNLTSSGNEDIFISKFDSSGSLAWTYRIGDKGYDYSHSISIDDLGNIYLAGMFSDSVDFDPGPDLKYLVSTTYTKNLISVDAFILKMDTTGNFIWAKQFGGNWWAGNFRMDVNNYGDIYTSGDFLYTVDFDPGHGVYNLTQEKSSFIHKMSSCISGYSVSEVITCKDYLWSANGKVYTESGKYVTLLSNAELCDSIVEIDLTINRFDNSVILNSNTLTANVSGLSYQWVDCDNDFKPIPNETGQLFKPKANGNYAVEITQNNCSLLSNCTYVTTTGISHAEEMNSLSLYPNPTNNKVTIIMHKMSEQVIVTIRNINGQVISNQVFRNSRQIDMEINGSKGIYFIEVLIPSGEIHNLKVSKIN